MTFSDIFHPECDALEPYDAPHHVVFSCLQWKTPSLEVCPRQLSNTCSHVWRSVVPDESLRYRCPGARLYFGSNVGCEALSPYMKTLSTFFWTVEYEAPPSKKSSHCGIRSCV